MDSSNPQNAYKFSKEATLDQYLKDKAADDEMKKNAMLAYKRQRRKVIQSAVMQIAMVGLQAGMQSMGSTAKPGAKDPTTGKTLKAGDVRTAKGDLVKPGSANYASAFQSAGATIGGSPQQIDAYAMDIRGQQMMKSPVGAGDVDLGKSYVKASKVELAKIQHQATMDQFRKETTKKQSFMQQLFGIDPGRDYSFDPRTNKARGKTVPLNDEKMDNLYNRTPMKGPGGGGITRPKTMVDASRLKSFRKDHDIMHAAAGGPAHTRGRDTVPAMLTAGEWVVPKETVDLYGMGFMNKLNKGEVQHFAEGGYVGPRGGGETPSSGGGSASSVNNDFTINVNVTNEGGGSDDGRTALGEKDQNTQGGLEENERNKELGVRIKGAVVQEIVYQKRPGGLLYNEKRS